MSIETPRAACHAKCSTDDRRSRWGGPPHGLALVAAVLLVSGCAHASVDPFFDVPAARPGVTRSGLLPPQGDARGFDVSFELRELGADGEVWALPHVTVAPDTSGYFSSVMQRAFVESARALAMDGATIADPSVNVYRKGLVLETVVSAGRESGTALLGYRARMAEVPLPLRERDLMLAPATSPVTIQLPDRQETVATGVCTVPFGRQVLLGHLPIPGTDRNTALYARVHEVALELTRSGDPFPEQSHEVYARSDDDPALRELVARSGAYADHPASLRVALVRVEGDLAPGEARDPATFDGTVRGALLGGVFGTDGNVTEGVRIETRAEAAYVADYELTREGDFDAWGPVVDTHLSGLTAEIVADRRVRISWTPRPHWHDTAAVNDRGTFDTEQPETRPRRLELPLVPGDRIYGIAPLLDGGVAAVWIRFAE